MKIKIIIIKMLRDYHLSLLVKYPSLEFEGTLYYPKETMVKISPKSRWFLKIAIIILIILAKVCTFYDELQFNWNESYFYIQKLMQNKSEKLFQYIQLKMRLKFLNAWITWFQYMAIFLIPAVFISRPKVSSNPIRVTLFGIQSR